jgi:lysozyme
MGLGGAASLVDKWEGYSATPYRDSVGIKTICRGHTGALVKKSTATQAECDVVTLDDLKTAAATVDRCATAPLTDGERNAWTSFAFNVGPGKRGVKDGFCVLKSGREPGHLKLMREGNPRAACGKLLEWNKAGGRELRGLTNRRVDELAVCLQDLP